MINAIINADDFGISENVNDAICLCFEKGIINNTTIMVNMPYATDAVKLAKEKGFFERVGLHLNLTAGVPLTSAIRSSRTFCDGRGQFHAGFHLSTKTRLMLSPADSRLLSQEIEAQIGRYLAFGLLQKHMDSHHHSHTDLAVWRAAKPLLIKYGFKSVRLSRNIFAEGKSSFVNGVYKNYYNENIRKAGFNTTDYFGSFDDFRVNAAAIDGSRVEIMVHPMFSESGELVDTERPMEEVKSFLTKEHILLEG